MTGHVLLKIKMWPVHPTPAKSPRTSSPPKWAPPTRLFTCHALSTAVCQALFKARGVQSRARDSPCLPKANMPAGDGPPLVACSRAGNGRQGGAGSGDGGSRGHRAGRGRFGASWRQRRAAASAHEASTGREGLRHGLGALDPLGSSTRQATAFQMQGVPQSLGSSYQSGGSRQPWNGQEGGHKTWFRHTCGHAQVRPRASGDSGLGPEVTARGGAGRPRHAGKGRLQG